MFNFIFGNKATITEKVLEQNKIKIIPKHDLTIDKKNCIAITGSGKFHQGNYKNEPVTIKVKKQNLFITNEIDRRNKQRRYNSKRIHLLARIQEHRFFFKLQRCLCSRKRSLSCI